MLFATLSFMAIAGAAFGVAHLFVRRWRPKPQLSSQIAIVTVSTLLVFVSVFFFTAWGYNPAVIQVNLQQSLNPLRWAPWLLSALSFGVAQAFMLALLRSRVEQARGVRTLLPPSAGGVPLPTSGPGTETVPDAVTQLPPGSPQPRPAAPEQFAGFSRPPFRYFAAQTRGAGAKRGLKLAHGDRAAIAVLSVWALAYAAVTIWVLRF